LDSDRHPATEALHHRVHPEAVQPVVTPLYQNSAFPADSEYFYTRRDNPNVREFEGVVAGLERAAHAVAFTTGMTAISTVLATIPDGSTIVLGKHLYGCSLKLFMRMAERHSLELVLLDLSGDDGIRAIPGTTKLVFFETPTNPFLLTISIRAVADRVRECSPDALVVVDNTWATPLHQRPLEHGADISLHSATKFFSGHSDVMGGVVATNREDIDTRLREERFYTGAILDPHSAWLLRRSVQTLALRMQAHARTTAEMARFLESLPGVGRVYLPEIDGTQLQGYGGILFFELAGELSGRYPELARALSLFDTGTGMACVTSMVAQPWSGSHASLDDGEKGAMGLGPDLVRLCFGLEDLDDLRRDVAAAFDRIRD